MKAEKEDLDLEAHKDALSTILSVTSGRPEDIAYALYCRILEAPAQIQAGLLGYIANIYDDVQSSETLPAPSFTTDQETSSFKSQYAKIVDAMLDALVNENLLERGFYEKLWGLINNPLFPSDKAKSFALYWILIDQKIPYFPNRSRPEDVKRRLSEVLPIEVATLHQEVAISFGAAIRSANRASRYYSISYTGA